MPDFNFTSFWNAFSNASYILTHSVIFTSKSDQWMSEIGVYLGELTNELTTTSPPLPRDDLKIILSGQKVEKWYLKYVALSLNSVDHRNLTLQPCVLKSATLMENLQFTWKIHISSNATLNQKQHTRSS